MVLRLALASWVLLVTSPAGLSQVVWSLDPTLLNFTPADVPSPLVPGGGANLVGAQTIQLPAGVCNPVMTAGQGGLAVDHSSPERFFYSDGCLLVNRAHPIYSLQAFGTCVSLIGGPYAVPIGGLAFNSNVDHLYLVDAMNVLHRLDQSGLGATFTPVTLSFVAAGATLTGLGYEPQSGSLWACDDQNNVYNFTTGGAQVGLTQSVSFATSLTGLTVIGSDVPASQLPCGQPAVRVVVTDGIGLFDAVSGQGFAAGVPGAVGLGFSPDAQRRNGTPTGPSPLGIALQSPLHAATNVNVTVSGAAVGTPVALALNAADCPFPAPGIVGGLMGGYLWSIPNTANTGVGTRIVPGTGVVRFSAPPLGIAGVTITLQAADVLGRFSDALCVRSSF